MNHYGFAPLTSPDAIRIFELHSGNSGEQIQVTLKEHVLHPAVKDNSNEGPDDQFNS
jgi:hypothetical protein